MGRFINYPLNNGDMVMWVPHEANGDVRHHSIRFGIVVSQEYPYALVRWYDEAKAAGTFHIDAKKIHSDELVKFVPELQGSNVDNRTWIGGV